MVGRLLDDDVAGFEVDRLVVEHHVDFARHDDGVVDRARPVHERIAYRNSARRRVIAGEFHHQLGWHFGLVSGPKRWDFDNAEHSAVIRRIEAGRFGGILCKRKSGRGRVCKPQIG